VAQALVRLPSHRRDCRAVSPNLWICSDRSTDTVRLLSLTLRNHLSCGRTHTPLPFYRLGLLPGGDIMNLSSHHTDERAFRRPTATQDQLHDIDAPQVEDGLVAERSFWRTCTGGKSCRWNRSRLRSRMQASGPTPPSPVRRTPHSGTKPSRRSDRSRTVINCHRTTARASPWSTF
jgi:hypothetical protein